MKIAGGLYRFALVGTVGFIVDASVLQMLVSWFGVGLLTGRIFGYLAAATITWFCTVSIRSATSSWQISTLRHRGHWLISGFALLSPTVSAPPSITVSTPF
ncbi:MAG: GtrA family protein [Haliea sp.]|nr:GtrA family protein [Haliea sp.]